MTQYKVFVTRNIPEPGIKLLGERYQVTVNPEDRVLEREELLKGVKGVHAILALLTDKIDGEVLDAAGPQLKVVANYAVGYDNLEVAAFKARKIYATNTPGVLTEAVAEHTFALLMAIARRIPESDAFTKAGKYKGWEPMLFLGTQLEGKILGIIGLGRIGSIVAKHGHAGFGMRILYYDPKRNEDFEREFAAEYREVPSLLKESDFVSIHVPLLASTRHLIDAKALATMKKTAYLINTSRGPVVDENALVEALEKKQLAGAALDVFENEPKLAPGLAELSNVVLTPHTASATVEARSAMSEMAAKNIIEVLEGRIPPQLIPELQKT